MAETKKYQNAFIFEYLGNIIHDKNVDVMERHLSDRESMKSFPFHTIMRYLSMCEDAKIRNYVLSNQVFLERLDGTGHSNTYRFLFSSIPQTRSSFIRYLK